MANVTGDRYSCSNANCGCEIEVLRPCSMSEAGTGTRTETGRRTAIASDLNVPPSKVNEPRINPGLQQGAGERSSVYGSPKFQEPGAFRDEGEEEDVEEGAMRAVKTAGGRGELFTLTCFCGSPMILSSARSTSARAGGNL